MNALQEKTLSHFTGNPEVSDISVESLQELAVQYPYFAPAQFFLASRLKQRSHGAASAQVVRTALYFTNPLWLQWQLYEEPIKRKSLAQLVELAEPAVDSLRDSMQAIEEAGLVTDEPAEMPEEQPETAPPAASAIESRLSGMLTGQLADFRKPVSEADQLDIEKEKERLHTIDYFASQGIRIDLSRIPQDKLTTQLRKFTDWLKQMKNPNPGQVDLGTSTEMENAVVEIAKSSNVSREVMTEAMAEVLVKQGQVDKAIQLFIKLSFINPEKSSYFAARIEQLKGLV
jgi:hypothetical protein